MKFKYFALLLPIFLFTGCHINTTEVKTVCSICNNSTSPISSHYGEKNLGIISLNSFNITAIEINQYDEDGNIQKRKNKDNPTLINNFTDFSSVISTNSNRGYAVITIMFNPTEIFDVSGIEKNICADCLEKINSVNTDTCYTIWFLDFETMDLIPLQQDVTSILFNDYFISCKFSNTHSTTAQADLLIFYCPERYK